VNFDVKDTQVLRSKMPSPNGRFGAMAAVTPRKRKCVIEILYPAASVVEAAAAPSRWDGNGQKTKMLRSEQFDKEVEINRFIIEINFQKMTKVRLNLRRVVKIGVTCLAVCMMFSGCKSNTNDKKDDPKWENGNGNGNSNSNSNSGNIATVALTIDLLKGNNDNEIIVKCTPKCPWAYLDEGVKGFPVCYFNQSFASGEFYIATKTGGNATQIFTSPNDNPGWNDAGTEYTYKFGRIGGENWEGTVTLAPVDQQHLQDVKIEKWGVKSITIGKNDPVPLKLGN
jgi:hypothetical protein